MKTQVPPSVLGNSFAGKIWFRKALCVAVASLPVIALADQAMERAQEIIIEQTKEEDILTPSAKYLSRSNAAPYILKVLMDQHANRGRKLRGDRADYVFIGSLQSVLSSLEEARNSFLAASQEDNALSTKQKTVVTKLKTAPRLALAKKERNALSERELIDLIVREITDVAPLVKEFHAEERLQKDNEPLKPLKH